MSMYVQLRILGNAQRLQLGNKVMKKIITLFLGVLILPSFVYGAFNDVTLTTDTVISVGGYTLNVSGSSAVVQSIVIDTSSFSVTLSSGSSIQITSPTYQQLSVDVGTFTTSNTCITNSSVLTLASSGPSGTVIVTPTATICSTPVSSGGGGGGGSSAPYPTAPIGGFTATADPTNSQNKTILHFGFGNDITQIAISDNINFSPATFINATNSVEWAVSTTKILYVKYCNRYSRCSNPISVQINAYVSVPTTPIVSNSYKFYRNLGYKMTGLDVIGLQKYLNTHSFVLAQNGAGSVGKETNYFGLLTKTALIKFQEAHASDILIPLGLTKGTGYFGPSTHAFVNK